MNTWSNHLEENDLLHYGILRRSGRYPWGSGKDEYARAQMFYETVDAHLRPKNGGKALSEAEVAQLFGMSVNDLRSTRTIAKETKTIWETQRAVQLREKGMSPKAIADQMGLSIGTVRARLKPVEQAEKQTLRTTAKVVQDAIDKHGIVDVGKGVEHHLGISKTRLMAALSVLRGDGYETHTLRIRQSGTDQFTLTQVAVPPGVTKSQAYKLKDQIHTMGEWSEDNGATFFGIHTPKSISSSRVKVVFDEDRGTEQDGVVYVRAGVKDLDMGKNTYAQVRIAVDGTHYIKGMAMLKDDKDMPDGVDLVFHSNKSRSVGLKGALKELEDDPDNPFGSMIRRQILETDPKTGETRARSAVNLVNEEGDWDNWRLSLPSQMLAKQPHSLIKSHLVQSRKEVRDKIKELDEITNPVIRRKKLEDLAERIDADAVDLRAAAMPGQRTQVILPLPKMSPNEVYAPNFNTGDKVVLIRYPHGGQYEIPELVVNNNNRSAKKALGNAPDAIGINPKVAERLSGADFDGDTVVVIPNPTGRIKSAKTMSRSDYNAFEKQLNDFDPKKLYGGYKEVGVDSKGKPIGNFKLMTNTGLEMGKITNLITDMQIQGAQADHVARAIRHSMVVIDAEKHKLNYKKSEIDHGVSQLKALYQGSSKAGATTLLSIATAKVDSPERQLMPAARGGSVDKETGALRYEFTGRTNNKYDSKTQTYTDEKIPVTKKTKRLALTDDAFDLVNDPRQPVERMYAEHANELKALANQVRLTAVHAKNPPTSAAAKAMYRAEVDDLTAQLKAAEKQIPLDRRAQRYANAVITQAIKDDPTLRVDYDRKKKVERQAKVGARARLNLTKPTITISDSAWDAIQAGAISPQRLRDILKYADPKRIDELSRPRTNTVVTGAIASRARTMLATGNVDVAAVARSLGVSVSTLREAIKRGDV